MADFRGTLTGTGHCSRLGSARTGLHVEAGNWTNKIVVHLWRAGGVEGRDRARITLQPGPHGSGPDETLIWEGWLD